MTKPGPEGTQDVGIENQRDTVINGQESNKRPSANGPSGRIVKMTCDDSSGKQQQQQKKVLATHCWPLPFDMTNM